MTKTLVEIWYNRNKPLLSERGLTLILRERGLTDSQIKQILNEISFLDILKKARGAVKKVGSAAKAASSSINVASGKLTSKTYEIKATSKWKKYAGGAGIQWDKPNASDFLEWLENVYDVPDFIIDNLRVGNTKLVDLVKKGPAGLTRSGVESLLKQLAQEEFKFVQSRGRYSGSSHVNNDHNNDSIDADVDADVDEVFKKEFLNTLKKFGISTENAIKLKQAILKNPNFLNQLLSAKLDDPNFYATKSYGA